VTVLPFQVKILLEIRLRYRKKMMASPKMLLINTFTYIFARSDHTSWLLRSCSSLFLVCLIKETKMKSVGK